MQEERKTEKGRGHMIKCLWTDLGSAGLENIWLSVTVMTCSPTQLMIKYLFQVHCLIQLILLSKGTLVRTNVFLDLRFSFNVNIRLTGRGRTCFS